MNNEDRMIVMNRLVSRKLEKVTHDCIGCNSPSYCAMMDGKSVSTCWCFTKPQTDTPSEHGYDTCVCPNCLIRLRK